jgi:hypothetical protein
MLTITNKNKILEIEYNNINNNVNKIVQKQTINNIHNKR